MCVNRMAQVWSAVTWHRFLRVDPTASIFMVAIKNSRMLTQRVNFHVANLKLRDVQGKTEMEIIDIRDYHR